MYLSEIRIESDCGLTKAADETLEPIISMQVYPVGRRKNYLMSFTSSRDTSYLKKSFSTDFVDFNLVKAKRGTFIHGVKKGHGVMDAITRPGNIPLFPVLAYKGEEHFLYLSNCREKSKESIDTISDNNSLVYSSIRSVKSDEIFDLFSEVNKFYYTSKLTDTELKVVKEAYSSGYYEWPRVNDLGKVSEYLDLSKPTVLYHIRNAEKKIVGSLLSKRR